MIWGYFSLHKPYSRIWTQLDPLVLAYSRLTGRFPWIELHFQHCTSPRKPSNFRAVASRSMMSVDEDSDYLNMVSLLHVC